MNKKENDNYKRCLAVAYHKKSGKTQLADAETLEIDTSTLQRWIYKVDPLEVDKLTNRDIDTILRDYKGIEDKPEEVPEEHIVKFIRCGSGCGYWK